MWNQWQWRYFKMKFESNAAFSANARISLLCLRGFLSILLPHPTWPITQSMIARFCVKHVTGLHPRVWLRGADANNRALWCSWSTRRSRILRWRRRASKSSTASSSTWSSSTSTRVRSQCFLPLRSALSVIGTDQLWDHNQAERPWPCVIPGWS